MRLPGRLWLTPALFAGLAGCGLDALFLTPRGFEPSQAPRTQLAGFAEPGAELRALDVQGTVVAAAQAGADGRFLLDLSPGSGSNLRLTATLGARRTKAVVPSAPPGVVTELGALDAASTARAQVVHAVIVDRAGSTFAATPPAALAALAAKLEAGGTELAPFTARVGALLAAAPAAGAPLFLPDSAALSPGYAAEQGLSAAAVAEYDALLARAAAAYTLEVRCDPARLAVLFTVVASGRGRDGNGAPQLLRQPPKEGRVFLGFTADESSPIQDDAIPRRLTPNDARFTMKDDGTNGDELAGDGIYSVVVALPRGARILYKYTNGAAGEGFTGTEEWPGNARILAVEDVLTGRPDGAPDCLVVRRDSFGDEASNKNFVNQHARAEARGGTVGFDTDLGGAEAPASPLGPRVGGLTREELLTAPPLTPAAVPEARENGVCAVCPPPLVLDPDDATPPALLRADRVAVDRVRLRFSEPIHPDDARDVGRFLYLDSAGRSVAVREASGAGSEVDLWIAPAHPREPARLLLRALRDASARANVLEAAEVAVGPDLRPPRLLGVQARSLLEVSPGSAVGDPTVGEVLELFFDERPEASAASDPRRYTVEGLGILAASPLDDNLAHGPGEGPHRVRLLTEPQGRAAPYTVTVRGVRDPAGNAEEQSLDFEGFGLFRARFQVVPGFAFASSDGAERGLVRGERLYLTGTPLAAARDLAGRPVMVSTLGYTRTDLAGFPAFELVPRGALLAGRAVYELSLLLPRGSWGWKAAHGVEGEYVRPPTTLEKVYKTLATTNDSTGVRVDPVSLVADNGVSYAGARLSETGQEPARRGVLFKREAPDEVCEVHADVDCPPIVIGAWRDWVLDPGGRTRDYDDGLVALPPHRPTLPDLGPPALLDARARDSYSVLLSFDEALSSPAERLRVELARAADGQGLPVEVLMSDEVAPHQVVVRVNAVSCAEAMSPGQAYSLRYSGAADLGGRAERRWSSRTFLAPAECRPFSPLTDGTPPRLLAVRATDLTELSLSFDEPLDPASAGSLAAYRVEGAGGGALAVERVELPPDRRTVRLATEPQQILGAYRLVVSNLTDTADPPNVLTSTRVSFLGFGERVPPVVARARAIAPDRVLVRFDEPVESQSALDPARYSLPGLAIREVAFAGDPGRRPLAFNPALAPRVRDTVLLTTDPIPPGATVSLTVDGVRDLSGNPAQGAVPITGVGVAPRVDVVLEYLVSDAAPVAGVVPSRALGPAELADAREGLFVLGAEAGPDQRPRSGRDAPVNDALFGFGVEGQALDGIEPRLLDNGVAPDRQAGDGVFSLLVPAVPLGTTIIWKAFAPYTTGYRDRNPQDTLAAFADALPGPSVFADGQEYPGNENGVLVLDEGAEPGVLRVRCLFGDEVTYKKHTGGAAYLWAARDTSPAP